MKFLALAFVLFVAIELVWSESCQNVNDCSLETCNGGSHLSCNHGTCSCDIAHSCKDRNECLGQIKCGDRHDIHCMDSMCRCQDFHHGQGN